jgi:hypothetical protein
MKLAILGVLMSLCFGQESEQRREPLSVCEVMEQRTQLRGKIVTVRGQVKGGPHGAWLTADPTCKFELRTQSVAWPNSNFKTPGVIWPNIIYLLYPINNAPDESLHAPFEVDWASVRRAQRQEKRQGAKPGDQVFLRPSPDCWFPSISLRFRTHRYRRSSKDRVSVASMRRHSC